MKEVKNDIDISKESLTVRFDDGTSYIVNVPIQVIGKQSKIGSLNGSKCGNIIIPGGSILVREDNEYTEFIPRVKERKTYANEAIDEVIKVMKKIEKDNNENIDDKLTKVKRRLKLMNQILSDIESYTEYPVAELELSTVTTKKNTLKLK